MLAGLLTKTDIIGCIGGTKLSRVKTGFDAFTRGAHAANPRVRVVTSYIGNWDDVSAGREQDPAQSLAASMSYSRTPTQPGSKYFRPLYSRVKAFVFGSNANQNDVAPEVTLGSVVIDLPRAFLLVAREVKEGKFKPRVSELDAATVVVKLVLNPARESDIPAAVRRSDSVAAALKAGAFSPTQASSPK